MAGVEEARRPALRRLLPREQRLGRGHVVAPFLQRAGHRLELFRLSCAVERAARLVVVLERLLVFALRLRVRLDRLLELLDVVRERDQVVVRGRLHFGELCLPMATAPDDTERGERQAAEDEEADQNAAAGSGLVAGAAGSAAVLACSGDAVDEVDQRGGDALAAVGVERVGRELSGDARRQDLLAAGAEVPADDDRVGAWAVESVVEGLQHAVRVAAGLLLRRSGQDRDVDGTGARRVDRRPDAILLSAPDCELRVAVDVNGIGLQRGDGGVDPLARACVCAQRQGRRDGHGQDDGSSHRARLRRARRRAS